MTDSDDSHPLAQRIATSVQEQIDEQTGSRRRFLSRSALAGGTLLALGGSAGLTLAQEDDGEMDGNATAGEMEATFDDVAGTDIDVLNYALTLEHLENAFYRDALETFDESDFMAAESLQSFGEETRQMLVGYVETIGEHESTHVDVLTQAVELLGGAPSQEGSYDFGVESVDDFLALGQVFENTGVAAYAGAGTYIESPDLQSAALAIHSVEGRHAAVLNMVNGDPPFPDAFDPASAQDEVIEAVSEFIESSEDGGGNGTGTGDGNGNGTSGQTPTPAGNQTG